MMFVISTLDFPCMLLHSPDGMSSTKHIKYTPMEYVERNQNNEEMLRRPKLAMLGVIRQAVPGSEPPLILGIDLQRVSSESIGSR
ncbi:hypothetical protein Aduo_012111 [Ancylostoma duodenale]